jgi:Plasmid encoded RepA protein
MNNKNLNKLILEILSMEEESAKEAGTLGYMARILTQATIPHKKVLGNEFTRTNGLFSLSIISPSKIGLPYGTIPRLLLSWITTEAVRKKTPEIVLGQTLSGFMQELGLIPSGGRWGTIIRLRDQMQRLFSSSISCHYEKEDEKMASLGFRLAKGYDLWWEPKQPEQATLWKSTVTLSKDFFEEIVNRPVPIDLRALKALKRSPLSLDVYCWLTYRMSYLNKQTNIPWEVLQAQFGSDYARTRDFKKKFIMHLRAVRAVYPEAKIETGDNCLILRPSNPHVPLYILDNSTI